VNISTHRLISLAWLAGGVASGITFASLLPSLAAATPLDRGRIVALTIGLVALIAASGLIAGMFGHRRRSKEAEIWRNRDFLAAVVENTADGIIVIDQTGGIRMYNAAAQRMFGYAPAEIVGKNVSMLLLPEEREKHDGYLRHSTMYAPKILGGQRTLSAQRKDGTVIPVEISVSKMESKAGPLFVGVCHDISERVRTEKALRESEARLQDAVESVQEGFIMFDSDDRLLFCNTRYRELYSLIADALLPGIKFKEILKIGAERGQFPEADGNAEDWIDDRMRLHRLGGAQVERQLPNGRWVKIEERRTRNGNVVGVRTDITELKARERQLRESEERYRLLVDLMPDGVMVHADGTIVLANDAMARILGLKSRDDMIGRREIDFIPPEDREAVLARRHAANISKATETRETTYLRPDGARVEIERSRAAITWEGNPAFLALARDITERKRTEKEITNARRQAETANKVKSAFLANMSHELRTPLNAIVGFSDLISREAFGPISPAKYRDYAGHIFDAGEHLLALINDILDLSKVEAGSEELQEEPIDVHDLVQSAVLLVQGRANKGEVRLTLDLLEGLPPLYVDPRKMKQIFVNILTNGVKFTEPGGSVTVKVRCRPGSGYYFQVADTGIGMALDDIPKALAPFGQVKRLPGQISEGTGLGLPLSKKLVELHGGVFDLQSAPGVGTTVTLEFPPDRIMSVDPVIRAGDRA